MFFAQIIYVEKENFFERALPAFIGALLAFIFSILLFYITEKVKANKVKADLEDNLSREIQFNLNMLEKMKIELERLIQDVSANNTDIFPVFKFDKYQRTFLLDAFNQGLLYKKLTDDEINTVDSMLGYFFSTTNDFLRDMIESFKTGETKPANMLNLLRYNVDEVVRYTDFLKLIQSRFKTNKKI